jgi:HSP20 family protein
MGKREKKETPGRESFMGIGKFFDGLGAMLERLGELAEKGEELRKSGEIHDAEGKLRGIYGFNVKVGLGKEGFEVEPFGNVRADTETGRPVVSEIREPIVDVFDEDAHVLVVAEMPGVDEADVRLDLRDDVLAIRAERGAMKYRKEVMLPASFPESRMSHTCRNGMLEVKFEKET